MNTVTGLCFQARVKLDVVNPAVVETALVVFSGIEAAGVEQRADPLLEVRGRAG